ncbi:MAG: CAP domain-containing protein [Bacteroidetes bacterium]|nr:CAP domain-containing protein [Bacteroidota bacterium]
MLFGSQVLQAQESAVSIKTMRQEVLELVNLKRSIFLQAPFQMRDSLNNLAQTHCINMAEGIVPISHDGFKQRDSMARIFFPMASLIGENVAVAQDADEIVEGWWNSEGHKANLLGDYTLAGIGLFFSEEQWYCTMLFVR